MSTDQNNPYVAPTSDLRTEPTPKGLSHWITIPVGVVLTYLGVFGYEPMLVDFIIQRVLSIPEIDRQIPMLALDLILSILTLILIFALIQWPSRPPKARASLVVASILFVFTTLLYFSPKDDHPLWYKVLVFSSAFLAWWLSKALYARLARAK